MKNVGAQTALAIMARVAVAGFVTMMTTGLPRSASAQCTMGKPKPVAETWAAATYTSGKAKITIYTSPVDRANQLQLTAGPDNGLWITDISAGAITKLSLKGKANTYTTPTGGSAPESIAYNGKDIFFTEWQTPCAGSITRTGGIQEYDTTLTKTESTSMTAGVNGYTWFGTDAAGIGSISPTGVIQLTSIPDEGTQFTGVGLGPDGNVWWEEFTGQYIGKITPDYKYAEYFIPNMPNGSGGFGITGGPDGRVWFVDTNDGQIGAIKTNGKDPVFYKTGLTGQPITITAGPDGNLYFGEITSVVGQITPSGVITEFPFPASEGSFPVINVTVGPDKNIWFSNNVHSQVGKLQLPIK
jgi:virginiamycin B lyase